MKKPSLILLLLAMPISACTTVGPDYAAPGAGALGVPGAYHAEQGLAGSAEELAQWWTVFDDPMLNRLVEQAVASNLDLAVASARLRQAREAVVQARAGRLPNVGASAGAGQDLDSDGNSRTNLSLGADASWEVDLFGGISRGVEASRADAEGAVFDLAAVQVAIVGEVATNYIQARLAQQRLETARDTLRIADENLEIAGWRVQAGLVSSLDSEQARAQRAQTAASIPGIESDFAAAAYRLAVLTGQAPGALTASLAAPRPIPAGPDTIAVGIPADTLRQRPDVRAAERTLAAQTARIGVAQAELYPALRLTGDIGASALSIGGLVDAIAGGIFGGLSQTLFDGGRLRSQVRSQEAATDAALATYRQSVLVALEDVENGLVALDAAKERQQQFAIALDAANNTAILARSQYRAGLTDFQTLLEAERSLLSARDGVDSSRAEQALALVQLYRALGGGWDPLAPDTGTAA
ncbi:efflux transporter outer membrane subunit [Enterovirga sp. GCM10030262]|uniref:efflux transporter outer membrane subunit n=1 Tax=Enterovirga sp. GCM10030262 TaxID=3273391 RepID=UPI003618E68F